LIESAEDKLDQEHIEQLATSGHIDEAVQAVLSLPPQTVEPVLIQTAKKLQADAVPLLQALDQPDKPKAVVKPARRALHRLRSQGVEIPEVVPPPADMGLVGGRRILRSLLSSVDGSGTQFLSVLFSAPMTGTEGVDLLGSDLNGIFDMHVMQKAKREYDEGIVQMRQEFTIIEAPTDYVLSRAREYEEINRRENQSLPSDYHIYRQLFHTPGREYDRPIVYDEIGEVDASLAGKAHELFQIKDFATWFLKDQIEPFVSQVVEAEESPIVLSDAAKQERIEHVLSNAAETIFTPEVRARYKRRLEENAYVLLHTDQAGLPRSIGDLAKVALACAAELSPDGPPQPAFVQEIVKYSVSVAVAMQERESPIHRIGT
jgi:hypothetical protein